MEFILYTAAVVVRGEIVDQFISESKPRLQRLLFLRLIDYFSPEHPKISNLKKIKSIDFVKQDCEEFQENCLYELSDYLKELGIDFSYTIHENLLGKIDNKVQVIESDIM